MAGNFVGEFILADWQFSEQSANISSAKICVSTIVQTYSFIHTRLVAGCAWPMGYNRRYGVYNQQPCMRTLRLQRVSDISSRRKRSRLVSVRNLKAIRTASLWRVMVISLSITYRG